MPTAWPPKDRVEINFIVAHADAAAARDDDDLAVKRIVDIGEPLVGASGRLIDLGGALRIIGNREQAGRFPINQKIVRLRGRF
jgi:hypothetical protein